MDVYVRDEPFDRTIAQCNCGWTTSGVNDDDVRDSAWRHWSVPIYDGDELADIAYLLDLLEGAEMEWSAHGITSRLVTPWRDDTP